MTIHADEPPALDVLEAQLGLPLIIKPARQGSSGKVSGSQEFAPAIAEARRHDRKQLAEEFIAGREVECSVLEETKGGLFVSRPGDPAESHGFNSYNAKYIDENGAALKVPAELPPEVESKIREMAARAFRALGREGWRASISS